MTRVTDIQQALQGLHYDGWLLYDFRNSNVLARRVLQIDHQLPGSRRWGYFIPATGTPRRLVHQIEQQALDALPGDRQVYRTWQDFDAGIAWLLGFARCVAMEYSPRLVNPYVSRVDAGLVELVRAVAPAGPNLEIVSSGDLIQQFEACWDDDQWSMHRAASAVTDAAYGVAWAFIADQVRTHGHTTEQAVQTRIMQHFHEHGLTTYSPPIVAVNAHSGDPHYETGTVEIRRDDFVLVDLWAKLDRPRAVYSDLTRVGFVGARVPSRYNEIFAIVASGRDAAIEFVRSALREGRRLEGWMVDRACRDVIERAGYGHAFVHRTGHSIGQEVHGNGANIDDLETHDTRQLLPGCAFSIEPGIYLPEFGVRSEVDVFIAADRTVHVTAGKLQTEVVAILD